MTTFEEDSPELNITPLVDIMLVLLAILMVTAPTLVYEEHITLPDGSKSTANQSKSKDLVIRVDVNKKVYIDQSTMSIMELPDNIMLLSSKYDKESPVYIKADKNLLYDDVMFVLKSVKNAGFTKVALQTNG
ncbi:polysaccharide deacetylase [Campylobacter sputorum subsp. bubulus]|uniref:Polysaccharide deacetylase n=1 Tax=Campylobacter sputorum subsp. sputorum TaxID=32024 RepID=A0A381DJF2_9BACT|nr:biopolymer transporter ExbD [Campylobacter sputorum]ASM35818.1 Tol-Pal system subunit TolR [Campylobacter sputorum aubsp. sputorum RM3237]ASM39176.1 Tol-Pal system subunit TolR [Campylobacter sputorum bv. paraureolyticus LMG 11764]KAB0581531.1 biopolymer transporter ExbD [Campylobacter sputorum subsp. sputorum]MDY6120894.1 biopolymer transporter ExbD [Campylobacter sputorum]QEL06008.1 Tol-Pal system subunit TolR [Campylobacter sputorum subsp. sputorum]